MTIRLRRILLPTDFSNDSAAATNYACELATKFDAELHLLHTLETHLASTPGFGMGLALPQYLIESNSKRFSCQATRRATTVNCRKLAWQLKRVGRNRGRAYGEWMAIRGRNGAFLAMA